MHFYVIIDTNIIVSAVLKDDSLPRKFLNLVDLNLITPLLSKGIICEYSDVLSREKFGFPKYKIDKVLDIIKQRGIIINKEAYNAKLIDEKDREFYEIFLYAKEKYKAYLVTGNLKHFPKDDHIVSIREYMVEKSNFK